MKIICGILLFVALLYVVVIGLMYCYQERFIFPGVPLPKEHIFAFDQPFVEVSVPVKGGLLNALHFRQKKPKGLVFFLHGNAGNLQEWTTGAKFYQDVNYDMFMIDYRGYGKSGGKISSEKQLHDDVLAAWNFIISEYQKEDKPIIIYGRSLGSSLAVELATKVEAEALVLVSAFTNLQKMAQRIFPWIPSWLLQYPFKTDEKISRIIMPIHLIHGTADTFIPSNDSRVLQTLNPNNATLRLIDDAGHNDIHQFEDYTKYFTKMLVEEI